MKMKKTSDRFDPKRKEGELYKIIPKEGHTAETLRGEFKSLKDKAEKLKVVNGIIRQVHTRGVPVTNNNGLLHRYVSMYADWCGDLTAFISFLPDEDLDRKDEVMEMFLNALHMAIGVSLQRETTDEKTTFTGIFKANNQEIGIRVVTYDTLGCYIEEQTELVEVKPETEKDLIIGSDGTVMQKAEDYTVGENGKIMRVVRHIKAHCSGEPES